MSESKNDNALPAPEDEQPVFTINELCDRWKVTRKLVMAAIKEERLHAFHVGVRHWRVAAAEVARFERVEDIHAA